MSTIMELLPWIGLFGPFVIAFVVLVAARLNARRPGEPDTSEHRVEESASLPRSQDPAPHRGRLRRRPGWLKRRSAETRDAGWQEVYDEASESLGSKYPYAGM